MLKVSKDIDFPLEAITETICILAIRGAGKTNTGVVMAEEMLKAGQPIVVYDPTGAWWGLKSSQDGKKSGFPVAVFGGEHGDIPLDENAGETIANVVVEKRLPTILDCSLMRKGQRIRFMTQFCETLYRINREPLHFFADEVHTIAPQNTRKEPEVSRLLGAMEDIILQGRKKGLGMTLISQRPSLVNTNLRTQCGTLIVMRIIGLHDRKAIEEWMEMHGTKEQLSEALQALPTLKVGEGFIWSPFWLNIFKRVQFRKRNTFDSSATPKVGERAITPEKFAQIDLQKLGQSIESIIQKKKENDPAQLKKLLQEKERELQELRRQPRQEHNSNSHEKCTKHIQYLVSTIESMVRDDRNLSELTIKKFQEVILSKNNILKYVLAKTEEFNEKKTETVTFGGQGEVWGKIYPNAKSNKIRI